MPNNWKTYKLSEVIKIIGGGTPKTSESSYWNGNIPWLSVKDFQGERKYVHETEKTITEEGLKKSSTKLLPKDSIIISARGTVGEMAVLGREMTFNQSCYGILPNERITNDYLYYLLKQKVIELQGLSYGSVFDTITTKTFDGLDISIPENLEEQKSIAAILSAIDDKIENNLAINKTLEEIAMALYKHWFVDFGPFQDGEFVESELGRIPKGWVVKSIYDVCDVIYGAPFKSKLFNENKNGFPLIRIRDLKTLKPQFFTEENHPKKTIIKAGDVVAGMDAEFDPYFWLGEDGVLNQRVVHFKPKANFSRMFIFHSVLPWLKFYAGAKVGTTVIHLGKSDIDNFKIAVPIDLKSIESFNEQTENYLEQIVNNSKENQTLTQLRDTLLPKLISGEVRLKEFRES
ncbi:MAG: restriction endonuclease subunit S [Flavobacterium sp.]|uniref:restriction endonuclease subunit S n=1 Tax=Flavobacterium sp. TaxID=239 RepID=UPI0037A387C0